jgi:hypothetical protein
MNRAGKSILRRIGRNCAESGDAIGHAEQRIRKGTPVPIVGALHEQNSVVLILATLADRKEET